MNVVSTNNYNNGFFDTGAMLALLAVTLIVLLPLSFMVGKYRQMRCHLKYGGHAMVIQRGKGAAYGYPLAQKPKKCQRCEALEK